ncbi:MAG: TIR domain-containing protein [Cyclobacteriaceae bacterium]
MAVRVFISHSHEDHMLSSALTELLCNTLGLQEEEILNTSQVNTGLVPGSIVSEELREAMTSAEVVLVVITPASGERPWVQFEAGGAFFSSKRLYILLHPSAKSPHTLPNNPTLMEQDEEIAKLIDAIRNDLEIKVAASTVKTIQAISNFIGEVKAYNPEYTLLHYRNRLELQIGFGDVFEYSEPGGIALACDNRFDLVKRGEGSQLYERTLIGQFRRRFFKQPSLDDFREYMIKGLGGSSLEDRFEVGHVAMSPFPEVITNLSENSTLFLVVLYTVADRDGVIEGAADASSVFMAYERLWTAAANHRPEAVVAPIFGAGQSAALLSRQQSCAIAITSALCVALRQPIYPRLRLLCRDRESYRALNIRAIAESVGLERGPRA